MIAVPGDTSAQTLSAIIADEAAIGMVNTKTTAVRLIPAPGLKVGDTVDFGGLLGSAPIMPVHGESAAAFIARGGRIPAPMHSLKKLNKVSKQDACVQAFCFLFSVADMAKKRLYFSCNSNRTESGVSP